MGRVKDMLIDEQERTGLSMEEITNEHFSRMSEVTTIRSTGIHYRAKLRCLDTREEQGETHIPTWDGGTTTIQNERNQLNYAIKGVELKLKELEFEELLTKK